MAACVIKGYSMLVRTLRKRSHIKYFSPLLFGPLCLWTYVPSANLSCCVVFWILNLFMVQSLAVILICPSEIISKSCFMLEFWSLICIALWCGSENLRRCKDVQVFFAVLFLTQVLKMKYIIKMKHQVMEI